MKCGAERSGRRLTEFLGSQLDILGWLDSPLLPSPDHGSFYSRRIILFYNYEHPLSDFLSVVFARFLGFPLVKERRCRAGTGARSLNSTTAKRVERREHCPNKKTKESGGVA